MNNNYLKYIAAALIALPLTTACLKENTPTSVATDKQLAKADKSGLSNAVIGYMTSYTSYSNGGLSSDVGFPGFAIYRDAMTADLPICSASYDYFSDYSYQIYIGNTSLQTLFWRRYYYLIQKANLLLGVANPEANPEEAVYMGNALAYRAMAYFDMARMYEYKFSGVERLDNAAVSKKVIGLTVPIVTENTTDEQARNNPRVPFYTMYRFILNDLNRAEDCLASTHQALSKTNACLGVVYGLKARFFLELGTRFENYPEDLSETLSHETDEAIEWPKLGISSAQECFEAAADYARKAINEGFSPVSQAQWFDTKSGFNSPNNAWMWCVTLSADDPAVNLVWQSYVSFLSPEATWGVADIDYNAGRMIDAQLYTKIPDSDWRKPTWIDPDEVASSEAFASKYSSVTSMGYDEWKQYGAYTGFKFHPGSGNRTTSTVGNAVSIPLMRVEEMYLIEAEAVGRAKGYEAGKQLLESFVNSYRYSDGSYSSNAGSVYNLVDDIFIQKRIELWGEGLVMWDYKRLEKAITRGYTGTNHFAEYRYNSNPGAVAPWLNFYIPDSERDFNKACVLNPDPSSAFEKTWSE